MVLLIVRNLRVSLLLINRLGAFKNNAAGLSPALAPKDYQIPIQGQGT